MILMKLRLFFYITRDMKKPVTVLTGMDYWLDNLMCNVPELAMCFHVDGIVQVGPPLVYTPK